MQIFFALSCLLAVLALSNGASVTTNSEQPRAELEAQVEVRQDAETAGQSRTAEVLTTDAVATDATAVVLNSTGTEETDGAVREKRTLRRHLLRMKYCGGECSEVGGCGPVCGQMNPCAQAGGCGQLNPCDQVGGCGSGCGGASPCEPTNVVVVRHPVPVPTPVRVPVHVTKVVRHPVPVPQPVAVPVTKFVPVPVPVEQPCCSQPQPCCGQAPLPCSPCLG